MTDSIALPKGIPYCITGHFSQAHNFGFELFNPDGKTRRPGLYLVMFLSDVVLYFNDFEGYMSRQEHWAIKPDGEHYLRKLTLFNKGVMHDKQRPSVIEFDEDGKIISKRWFLDDQDCTAAHLSKIEQAKIKREATILAKAVNKNIKTKATKRGPHSPRISL